MIMLSTGEPSTLGVHRKYAVDTFGEDSPAVKFLDERIAESPNGEDEEVIADEAQFVHVLMIIHNTRMVPYDS